MTGRLHRVHDKEIWSTTIFLGVDDLPLRKYVSSRQPTNEITKLEGQKIDVSSLTLADDFMDSLTVNTPVCHEFEGHGERKNSRKNLEESDASF